MDTIITVPSTVALVIPHPNREVAEVNVMVGSYAVNSCRLKKYRFLKEKLRFSVKRRVRKHEYCRRSAVFGGLALALKSLFLDFHLACLLLQLHLVQSRDSKSRLWSDSRVSFPRSLNDLTPFLRVNNG